MLYWSKNSYYNTVCGVLQYCWISAVHIVCNVNMSAHCLFIVSRTNEKARLLENVKNVFSFKSRLPSTMEVEMNRKWIILKGVVTYYFFYIRLVSARGFVLFSYSVMIGTYCGLHRSVNRCYFLDGFAFSQEEGGAVSQSDMIRVYNTCSTTPEGV